MHRISTYLKLRKNSFENIRRHARARFGSTEELCEHIGRELCNQIDDEIVTVEHVIHDAIQFSVVNSRDAESRYFSWLTLHTALGICFKYRINNKELTRQVLIALLPFSHGVDYGIYLRDILHGFRQQNLSSIINIGQNEIPTTQGPEKSLYFLQQVSGLTIDLQDPQLLKTLFDGTGRAVWAELLDRKTCLYIDLPVSHAHLQPMMIHQPLTASLQVSSILLAIMNMKPEVVLLLLRYGASPEGPPLRYIFRTLGTLNLFPGIARTGSRPYATPILLIADSLRYCLRVTNNVRLRTEIETIGNNRVQIYYVKHDVLQFVPTWVLAGISSLKHICRCFIRNKLLLNDQLPEGIPKLELPNTLSDYLDIKS